ncbi:hypothetical protein [Luteococcus peritonei]|uniref:Sensor domain-containing protein n=1 Tax=Luteococcus peritonei TaxID=88874 RepID=A0ABW4RRM0_9ACTN
MNQQLSTSRGPRPTRSLRLAALAIGAAAVAGATLVPLDQARAEQQGLKVETLQTASVRAASRPVALPAPTRANLALPADLRQIPRVGSSVGRAVDRPAGTWGSRWTVCQQGLTLGERSLLVRDYPGIRTTHAVLGFSSVARADRARTEVLRWFSDCATHNPRTITTGSQAQTLMVLPPRSLAGGVEPINAVGLQAEQWDRRTGRGSFEDVTVAITGNRLSILVVRTGGEDHVCAVQPDDEYAGQCGAHAAAGAIVNRQLLR